MINTHLFHSSRWSQLSVDEKLNALQDLENNLALEQGRKAINIKDPRSFT
ncbi:hypothetical protein [Hazenella coriacea]|nr:hypothetical protein [Hazenella coriacea]